eukprot:symbB.v1.2.036054.t1/scaffold5001.1/size31928/2
MELVATLTILMLLALIAIVVSTIMARESAMTRAQKLLHGHPLEDDRPIPFLDAALKVGANTSPADPV